MLVLDSDHLTLLEREPDRLIPLRVRLGQTPADQIGPTLVNYEEQMRGWLAYAAQVNTIDKMLTAYTYLEKHIETFHKIAFILPFDAKSAIQFESLRQARLHIGTMDLKIAAICLANNATLLTRNLKDFGKVPGLRAGDWSA